MAAVMALPAMWRGRAPKEIAERLPEVLTGILRPELVFVRLTEPERKALERWWPESADRQALEEYLADGEAQREPAKLGSAGGEMRLVVRRALPAPGRALLVAVASRRAEFPSSSERFLLDFVLEQASIAIDSSATLKAEHAARSQAEQLAEEQTRLHGELQQQIAWHIQLNAALREMAEERDQALAASGRAEQRQRFLAEASKVLDSSLDYRVTLDKLAQMTVPFLGDWCAVDRPRQGKLGRSVAIAHSDPAKVQLAWELQQRWPADMSDPAGVARVIRTGEPELYEEIPDEFLMASAKSEEQLRVVRELGPWCSGMIVPLNARGRTLGAMTLITAESGRQYGAEDLELALEVASRAALAMDNAELYEREQKARMEAERLQQLAQQVVTSLAVEEVLEQVARTAADLLGAPVAGVFLQASAGEDFRLVAGYGFNMAESGRDVSLPRDRSLATRVIRSGRAELVEDVSAGPVTALPRLIAGEPVGSLVVAPIVSRSASLGVIEVYSQAKGAFDERGADLLLALAATAAVALENASAYRAEQQARHEAERVEALRQADLARLETILEQLPVGVLVAEALTRRISVCNHQAEALFGRGLLELRVGAEDIREARRPGGERYEPEEWPITRALLKGELVSGEHVVVDRPDGGLSCLSVNAAPIRDEAGKIVAAVAVFDDVSGEEELRQQKEQFLAAAAHDLKTPLTAIRGLVQVLERQLRRSGAAQVERIEPMLTGVQTATRKMASLVDELLDVSRLDAIGQLTLNRSDSDLLEIARDVLDAQRPAAPEHTLELTGGAQGIVGWWDGPRLERALSNLVGNAIKYSPDGGTVRVAVSLDDDGRCAVVAVSDQGIGIPAGDMERIFERFQRGSNVPGNLAGSGVGLAYVRQVVMQHGGSMTVASRPMEGTTVTIRLERGSTNGEGSGR
ncbi:MAG: GAF domain-containing protein [Chloroflexi bacterium]|nr:GAF domain-containing protein [Chloroflexota bacterium]